MEASTKTATSAYGLAGAQDGVFWFLGGLQKFLLPGQFALFAASLPLPFVQWAGAVEFDGGELAGGFLAAGVVDGFAAVD